MYCKKCGKKLADGDRFCGNCGTKIEAAEINIGFIEDVPKPKKSFDFGSFNWDLDGYPDEEKTKTEDVDFNWNTVLEEKKRKDIEERSFTDTIIAENELFDKAQSEDNGKLTTEISFNWELGSTTRVDKTEKYDKVLSKDDAEETNTTLDMTEREQGAVVDDVDEALAAGLAAASSPRKSIDKFYTFNQKNEEFQALLDQEYERLRNRIREDNEAEAVIANKEEKLERARATWSKEAIEEPAEEAEVSAEAAEKVEIPTDELADSDAKAVGDEGNDVVEETEPAEDEEIEVDEEAEASEAEETENGALAEESENTVSEEEAENEAINETTEDIEDKEDNGEVSCEPASEGGEAEDCIAMPTPIVSDEIAAMKTRDSGTEENAIKVEDIDTEENEAEALDEFSTEKADSLDSETDDPDKEEIPEKPESGNPPSEETDTDEETLDDEDSKAAKLHYSDIFANDDVGDGDSGDRQKNGRWKIIVLDIVIFILAICVICAGMLVFAGGSTPAKKISQGITWVTEKFTGSNNESGGKNSSKSSEKTNSMDEIVASVKKKYVNIGKIKYDSSLKFDSSKDYGISDLKSAKAFKDVKLADGKMLSEAIVNLACGYYSGLTDKINSGSDNVLKLIDKNSELYGHIKAIAEGNEEQSIKEIKIGEIKGSDGKYYIILQVSEGKANSSSVSTEAKILSISGEGKDFKVTAVTDAK